MTQDGRDEGRRERLQTISDTLQEARDAADHLHAHLLAAKIEDSRVCAEELIHGLRH